MNKEWGITTTSGAHERAIPDSELLRATRSGDLEMFEVLWQRYSPQLLGYARKRVPAHQAEDAVSDVLLSTLRAILNGAGPERFFRAYAFQSLRNALGRQHEASRQAPPLDHEDLERLAPAAERPRSEDAMLVNALLAEFDDDTRLLLRLNLEEGRRISEIAETLSIAPEVASRRLYEAKDVFRAKWFAAHLDLAGAEPQCVAAMELAPHAFGRGAGGAKGRRFWAHVDECGFCGPRVAQAEAASRRLVAQWPVAFGAFALAEPGGLVLQALGWGVGAGFSPVPGIVAGGILGMPAVAKVGVGALAVVLGTAIAAGTALNSGEPGPAAGLPGRGGDPGLSAPASPRESDGAGGLEEATASPGPTQPGAVGGLHGSTAGGGHGASGTAPGGTPGADDDTPAPSGAGADPEPSGTAAHPAPTGTPAAPAPPGTAAPGGARPSQRPFAGPSPSRPTSSEGAPAPSTGRTPCAWAPSVACYDE